MSTEIKIGKIVVKGVFHIFTGKIISRVVGVLGGVILIRLLADPSKYGLLSVASIIPQILFLFTDLGIDTALTKYIAERKMKGDVRTVRSLFYAGLLMRSVAVFSFTFFCFFLSPTFSTLLLNKPYVSPFISVASLLILGWGLSNFSRSVFMGLDSTKIYAAFMVINEVLLSFLPIILVFYGLGIFGALVGMVIATGITTLLELITCLYLINGMDSENNPGKQEFRVSFRDSVKRILNYGLPVHLVILMTAGLGRLFSFLIAANCPDDQVGYYSTSEKSYAFVDYAAWPIRLVLFPAFSKINYVNQQESLKKTLKYSVKYSTLVILPLITLLVFLAHPLVLFLFGAEYEYAWVYLAIISIFGLSYGLGKPHIRKLLLAQGETRFVAKLDALTAFIGAGSALFLIPRFHVFGYIATHVSIGWPAYFLMIRKARRDYGISVPLRAVAKLYSATIVAGTATFLSSYFVEGLGAQPLEFLWALQLTIGALAGVAAYILAVLAVGGVNLTDIENLRELIKDRQAVGVFLVKLLSIAEKVYLRFHPSATA